MIPNVLDGDPEIVIELLQRAADLWERLEKLQAIETLKHAAAAASDAGKHERAIQLALAAADVEAADEEPTADVDVSPYRK